MKRLIAIFFAAAAVSTGVAVSQVVAPPPAAGPGPDLTPAAQPKEKPVLLTGPTTPARGQVVDGVAAVVNDDVITHSDVRNRMRRILLGFNGNPDQEILKEVQN